MPNIVSRNIYDPRELDRLGKTVSDKDFENDWLITTTLDDCVKLAEEYVKLGFNEIQFHSSSPDEDIFLEKFGSKILPYLKETLKVA